MSLLGNPVHFHKMEEVKVSEFFQMAFEEKDKILTVYHNLNPVDHTSLTALLAECLCRLTIKKNLKEVWKLTFRELENYLRDENHKPAFGGDYAHVEQEFLRLKALLIGFGYSHKLQKISSTMASFESLNLLRKNKLGEELCEIFGWEFIFSEGEVLYFKSQLPWLTNDISKIILESAAGESFKSSSIKLVAVVE